MLTAGKAAPFTPSTVHRSRSTPSKDGGADAHQRRALRDRRLEIVRHAHGKHIERIAAGDQLFLQLAHLREAPSLQGGVGSRLRNRHQAAQPEARQARHRRGERLDLRRGSPALARLAADVHLYADLERRLALVPRVVEAARHFLALDAVHLLEVLRDGGGLVALDRADVVPCERQRPQLRDFLHTLLDVVFTESGVAGRVRLAYVLGGKGLAHRDQLYAPRRPAGRPRSVLDARTDGLQVGGDWGHNFRITLGQGPA